MALSGEPLDIEAKDGCPLGATHFQPPDRIAPKGAVSIQPATGVPQQYYAKFAAFLASRGFAVLTFDYRGIGRSLRGPLKHSRARMRDWGTLDAPAALDFLEKTHSGAKRLVIGHSFGGQAIGLLPRPERIAAAMVVGSQSGYWRNWPPLGRLWIWPVTHLVLPTLPRLLGYQPMSIVGLGEDLPAGVAMEWARWCRNPRYLVGDLGVQAEYARFSAPLLAYSITDDRFAPPAAVQALLELFPAARSEIRSVSPGDLGVPRIGHFGFFRERFRNTLWHEAAEWLAGRRV